MQQRVSIIVACNSSGRSLFKNAEKHLSSDGFAFDRAKFLHKSHLAFELTYLDVWSLGDSFKRFLYPKSELRFFAIGSSELWAIRREKLTIRNTPRNEEEHMLRLFLSQAQTIYRKATGESYLFLARSVFDTSTGFNPEA